MKDLRVFVRWLWGNWVFGVIAWMMFALSMFLTVVCFLPVFVVLSIFGFDWEKWTAPFDQLWRVLSLDTVDAGFGLFSIVFFPFVFRNFIKAMSYSDSLKPEGWDE